MDQLRRGGVGGRGLQRRPVHPRARPGPHRREHRQGAPDGQGHRAAAATCWPSACARSTPPPSRRSSRCSSRPAASPRRPTSKPARRVSRQDADVVGGLRQHKADLATLRTQLVDDRQEAAAQVAARAREQARVEELLRQRKAVFASADADLRRLLKEEKERREREAAAAAALARAPGRPRTRSAAASPDHQRPGRHRQRHRRPPRAQLPGRAVRLGRRVTERLRLQRPRLVRVRAGRQERPALHRARSGRRSRRWPYSDLQPGDLVFFYSLDHVGIYLGGDQFVHAPHTGDVVKVSQLSTYPATRGRSAPSGRRPRSGYAGRRRAGG